MNGIPQGLYISPMIKGQGIAPPLYERLDDLVQSGERATLENLLRWTLRRLPQADESSIQEWINKKEPDAVLANHIALLLKYDDGVGRDNLAAINAAIKECTPK